jgi:hypothetical protein
MAQIMITGGTGFIGSAIVKSMVEQGHQIVVVTRSAERKSAHPAIRYTTFGEDGRDFSEQFGSPDVIINLAGDPINKGRWTDAKKSSIIESRVQTTRRIVSFIERLERKPALLINASAIGYYGFSEDRTFSETDRIEPHNFLTEVSAAWETEALRAESLGVRVALARFGIVLGSFGGALAPMVLPYKMFAGGTVASGKQWLSWIHIDDVVGLIHHLISTDAIRGPVNFTAPQPLTMKQFGQTIGAVLHRPHWMPVPAFALRILFGEMADLLIKGQKVMPEVAVQSGYLFRYADARAALSNLLQKK